jgi:hypothetical protein
MDVPLTANSWKRMECDAKSADVNPINGQGSAAIGFGQEA